MQLSSSRRLRRMVDVALLHPADAVFEFLWLSFLLWLLRGDAGQRALIAWSMGWTPAREASGAGWMAPFLSTLLIDPYAAIRYIAGRSLRRLPEYEPRVGDEVGRVR